MVWTSAGYVNRGVKHAIANPTGFAFLSVLFAFFAGYEWRDLKGGTPLDFAHGGLYLELLASAMCGYFLTRAIRQLRDGGTTAS